MFWEPLSRVRGFARTFDRLCSHPWLPATTPSASAASPEGAASSNASLRATTSWGSPASPEGRRRRMPAYPLRRPRRHLPPRRAGDVECQPTRYDVLGVGCLPGGASSSNAGTYPLRRRGGRLPPRRGGVVECQDLPYDALGVTCLPGGASSSNARTSSTQRGALSRRLRRRQWPMPG